MSDASIVREYALSLGWQIDEQSFKKYAQTLKDTDNAVLAVGASLAAVGVAAFVFTDKMANSMEKLYFATRRTGSTAAEYQGFALAIQNAGGSAEGARQSLENLAAFTRNNPNGGNLLMQLGVDPKHIGHAKEELDDLAEKWRSMPFWQARMQAQMVGVDDMTLMAMQNGDYQDQTARYDKLQKMFGMNMPQALKGANEFESKLRNMEATFVTFGQWLESDLNGPMGHFVDWTEKALLSLQKFIQLAQTSGLSSALQAMGVPKGLADLAAAVPGTSSAQQAGIETGILQPVAPGSTLVGRDANALGNLFSRGYGELSSLSGRGDASANSKAQYVYSQLRKLGVPDTQAIGMTGAFWTETGGSFSPSSTNPTSGAYGLEQLLSKDRLANFKAFAGQDVHGSTLDQQIAFAAHEVMAGSEKANTGRFMRAKDPYSAGYIYENDIERSASEKANGASGGYARHVANTVTVHIHGNADKQAVSDGVFDGLRRSAPDIARQFR